MVTLSGQVRTILGLSLNRDFGDEIKSVLNGLKVDFEIKKIIEERVNRFSTIEQEASSILYQLKLDSSFREKVETIVRELCSADSSGFYFNSLYSDKIFIF
jgi:DNA polymerase III delta subunit